jgi:hypothetical protein
MGLLVTKQVHQGEILGPVRAALTPRHDVMLMERLVVEKRFGTNLTQPVLAPGQPALGLRHCGELSLAPRPNRRTGSGRLEKPCL